MIIPQDILDDIRDKTSISNLISKRVSWDNKKTNPAKGDFWASCPFHSERTASFHVDDSKGYYYCFGCHKKGDVITFKMEAENLSFVDAVKILADESGIILPTQNFSNAVDKSKPLREIINESKNFFKLELNTPSASKVREYLLARNLSNAEINGFELGYSPRGPDKLVRHLIAKGYDESIIIKSGMALKSDRNTKLYDRFQERLMFPINDFRGRAVAFGGRALKAQQHAKYLNSPETPIFKKGSNLYNLSDARASYTKESPLIVVEGYMDVISLNRFGFKSCVAPLGTAVTAEQLKLLWKISPEPIVMMDGDAAGIRAANKLIDILLPLIEFNKTVRFCFLPKGNDPDDFVNNRGSEPLSELLSQSTSLSKSIWQRETNGLIFDSPERIASLNNRLRLLTNKISDKNLRSEYFSYFQKIKKSFFSTTSNESSQKFLNREPSKNLKLYSNRANYYEVSKPTEETKNSAVAKIDLPIKDGFEQLTQNLIQLEYFLLAFILFNWKVETKIFNRFVATKYNTASLKDLKRQLLEFHYKESNVSRSFKSSELDELKNRLKESLNTVSRKTNDEKFYQKAPDDLNKILEELLVKQEVNKSLLDEFEEATEEINRIPDETLTKRLKEAHQAFQNLSNHLNSKDLNSDDGFKRNSELLKKFIDDKIWKKT